MASGEPESLTWAVDSRPVARTAPPARGPTRRCGRPGPASPPPSAPPAARPPPPALRKTTGSANRKWRNSAPWCIWCYRIIENEERVGRQKVAFAQISMQGTGRFVDVWPGTAVSLRLRAPRIASAHAPNTRTPSLTIQRSSRGDATHTYTHAHTRARAYVRAASLTLKVLPPGGALPRRRLHRARRPRRLLDAPEQRQLLPGV